VTFEKKVFDPFLYQQYDAKAKQKLKEYLENRGYQVVECPFGQYDVDLGAWNKEKTVLFDVEVRPLWESGSFPFPTIHLPCRKEKFTNHLFPVFFVAFRRDLKRFVSIPDINLSKKIVVKNKYVANGERFFDVPIEQCREIILEGN